LQEVCAAGVGCGRRPLEAATGVAGDGGAAVSGAVGNKAGRTVEVNGVRMWHWWWPHRWADEYRLVMTKNTSKVEARRRVREAQARANETRVQREHANIEDAATYIVAVGKIREVDAWETERLAAVRDQIRTDASRRRADCQAAAGVAVAQMQRRGETLATIAEFTGAGMGEVRAMLSHAFISDEPKARRSPPPSNPESAETSVAQTGNGVVAPAAQS
jgi:hypothetical protein